MAMADVGDQRAFMVTAMKFPEGEQRMEQIQQIVDCMRTVNLYVENGNVVFGRLRAAHHIAGADETH